MSQPSIGDVLTWNGASGIYTTPSTPAGTITGVLTPGVIPIATGFNTLGDGYLRELKVTIPSANVKECFSSPYTLISAPGAGYAISSLDILMYSIYGGTAYATNISMDIGFSTVISSSNRLADFNIGFSSNKFSPTSNISAGTYVENDSIVAKTRTGNPTLGNSDITLYFLYRLITI